MELRKNKKVVKIIISVLLLGVILLLVISGICFRIKWEWIVEQFGVAVSTQDIDLLDELIDPHCEMYTTDNKNRVYSDYQRGVIEKLWNEETYSVTSYDPHLCRNRILDPVIFCWLQRDILYLTEMMIVDVDGKEYRLCVNFVIKRIGLFDAKIVQTWAHLH
ncbi:MAG: hypothetical protein K2K20_09275 [Lachnospiraceae bacterium]|nr:hypothetical protein [Lachnospiraceae bacterium]